MSPAAPARALRRAPTPDLAAARLALAEFLVGCEEASECAQWSLDWLGEHAGIRRAVAFMRNDQNTQLVAIAAYGGTPGQRPKLSIDLDHQDHALVAALAETKPFEVSSAVLGPRLRQPPLSGGARQLLVVPFRAEDGRPKEAPGVMVVGPPTREAAAEATWVAGLLGLRLPRIRAAQALGASQRRLENDLALAQGMINTVSDPILLTDVDGKMILANARAEGIFGAAEQDSEGRRRAAALNNMLFSAALNGEAIQRRDPRRRELVLVNPEDGSDLLFELISTVTHDPTGRVGFVSVLRNVMDLRRATEELEENYRRLREVEAEVRAERDRLDLIIDSVADPILVTDPGGAIVLMNAPAERLFASPKGAGSDVTVRAQSNDAHLSAFLANALFTEDTVRHAGHIGLTDPASGGPLPVEALAGKVFSQQGELIGIVTILHDQTQAIERERLYEQLKHASEQLEEKVRHATAELVHQNELLRRQALQLEQASALKTRFLANMSHEFRTPLNAILGYTSMLLKGVSGELEPPQKRSLARVDSSARHLLALINDILDISRIEAGKMPVNVTRFGIRELLTELMEEVEPIIPRTKLSVSTDVADDIPLLESDRAKVKQIVLNLVTNALKFTPEGWVKIAVTHDQPTDRVLIAVADTGIGITDEDQAKVFEDFRQADNSTTRAYGGAGLGLSISRRLAVVLGGQITLQSKPGQGSTFTLTIPRKSQQ